MLNEVCTSIITDGGWYECPTNLVGEIFSIHRISGETGHFNLLHVRAYSGINVAKWAIVVEEPVDHLFDESASNLLK